MDKSSPINIHSAGNFKAGDIVIYEDRKALIVDFVPATDEEGQKIEGFEALLYMGGSPIMRIMGGPMLSQVNIDLLKVDN